MTGKKPKCVACGESDDFNHEKRFHVSCDRFGGHLANCSYHAFVSPESPYVVASKKVREAALLIADLDAPKAQLLHALSQDVFEAGQPDLELPIEDHSGSPQWAVLTVDGVELWLVNWYDYSGWEVRIKGNTGCTLGFISTIDGVWAPKQPDRSRGNKRFLRLDSALRYMLNGTVS